MNKQLSSKFKGQWIGIKFYEVPPKLSHVERLDNVRFCEATRIAAYRPVILDKKSISCPGARYIFGWDRDMSLNLINHCSDKQDMESYSFTQLISQLPRMKQPLSTIGLNTDKNPDVFLSYLLPQEVMKLIRISTAHHGKCLDVLLCSLMSICGCTTLGSYLNEKMTVSFGCEDARSYAQIGKDRVAVGIPGRLIHKFLS
jgi:uncharacterized protein (DUF169 family)